MGMSHQFSKVINRIGFNLKNQGFKRINSMFLIQIDENIGIIDFQKSSESDHERILFTVNIGIVSKKLLDFFSPLRENEKMSVWNAHWSVRLGQLLPENKDMWWEIDKNADIDALQEKLSKWIVDYAIPKMMLYIRDEGLRDLWLTGKSPSLTNFQRLLYLSYFLKTLGPQEFFEETVMEINRQTANKPSAITAEIFLEKLGKLSSSLSPDRGNPNDDV